MDQQINDNDPVSLKELIMVNPIQVDVLAQFVIEKGVISQEEFYRKLKEVLAEYESRNAG